MKSSIGLVIGIVIVLIVVIVFSSSLYTVSEVEQVVVTQFGQYKRTVVEPGLHWKTPFIQKVEKFEKRIMEWDSEATQIPTREKKFIWVDTWARWRIKNLLKFYTSLKSEQNGQGVLDDHIENAIKDVISRNPLIEAVRNSNRELQYDITEFTDVRRGGEENVGVGRSKLVELIKKDAAADLLEDYGIELVDVAIKRINYVEAVRTRVYQRMISERKRIASRYRSEARAEKAIIEGDMQKELDQIRSEGEKTSREIRGEADALAIKIYADAYQKSPEFYSFLKTLKTYEHTADENTTLILSTDSDYFKYLKGYKER